MKTFDSYLVAIMDQAAVEAQRDRSATIEAHHLLLAVAAGPEGTGQRTLASAGLDSSAIRDVMEREFAHSLGVVGVSLANFEGARSASPAPTAERPTKIGASVKLALERGFGAVSRKRDIRPGHVLLGLLRAEVGTVPHALEVSHIDRNDLLARLEQALARGDG